MQDLKLYYSPTCPYCQKVQHFMQENNIVFPLMDVSEPENRQTLLEVGGKVQVPCLFINGKPMYESNDIINYLNK
ncbi:MAG: glutathione S-transferase N-terminal domain-containing protein [Coriobacteriales bacterium]|nr:glutathione S-transferase N-terminal domain-containing protein [Coriobacteriales bacterium]